MKRKFVMLVLLSVVLAEAAWAQTSENVRYVFNVDQNVEGDGFFNSYRHITAGNLVLNNLGYGSGGYSHDSKLRARKEATFDEKAGESIVSSGQNVTSVESINFAYKPTHFYFGKGFKLESFNSLGKDDTRLKNFASGVSMNALFESVDVLSGDISVNLDLKGSTESMDSTTSSSGSAKTELNIDSAFTGKGHIGALELNDNLHDVQKLVDEDYLGTFSLAKRISHNYKVNKKIDEIEESWLPCCFDGWNDMMYYDQKGHDAQHVFDCSCYAST